MFDPSVGTLKGSCPKNEVNSVNPLTKDFLTMYHIYKSV